MLIIFHKENIKNPIVADRIIKSYYPIGQPLAPFHMAGCCVVNGAVPHTLSMDIFIIRLLK